MSMDDTYDELRRFAKTLEEFNTSLNASVRALAKEHESISNLWQDSFHDEYQRKWIEFSEKMERYRTSDATRYQDFLKLKIQQLGGYLGK